MPPAGVRAAADSAAGPAEKCGADPPGADPGVGGEAEAGLTKHTSPPAFVKKTLPNPTSSYFLILLCSFIFVQDIVHLLCNRLSQVISVSAFRK